MVQTQGSTPSPIAVQKFLAGVGYPAKREDLVRRAKELSAPDDVVHLIEMLPQDEFEGPSGVMKAYGKLRH